MNEGIKIGSLFRVVSLFALLLLLISSPYLFSQVVSRYNVIMILVHDMNDHVNFLDEPEAYAPNFQRLASHGMVFKRNYCQYPLCSPSRTSLLSGWRPDHTNVFDNITRPRTVMGPDVKFLPEYFSLFGYRTERYGHILQGTFDNDIAWDYAEPPEISKDTTSYMPFLSQVGDAEGDWWIDNQADSLKSDGLELVNFVKRLQQPKEVSFFFALGMGVTHTPYTPNLADWNLNGDASVLDHLPKRNGDTSQFIGNGSGNISLPNTPVDDRDDIPSVAFSYLRTLIKTRDDWQKTIHAYDAEVTQLDNYIGRILDEIDRQDLWKNTVVVFCSDHGTHLGEHGGLWGKESLFEESLHAPVIICAPGKNPGVTYRLTEHVDLYATLAELCGLPLPPGMEGNSLVPLMENPVFDWKKAAFSQIKKGSNLMGRSVRTEQYRYNSWGINGEELYDHIADPNEYTNLAGNPQYQIVLDSMRAILAADWTASQPPQYKLLTFYRDKDDDGYGNASDSLLAYAAPEGYVSAKGDCDDNNYNVHPGANDICDGLDNNCNNLIDENRPEATITAKGSLDICSTGSVLLRANAGVRLRYQWRKDGIKIPEATARTYTASLPGRYRVLVRDSTNCSSLSNILTVVNSCIFSASYTNNIGKFSLLNSGQLYVYPVPSRGMLTVIYTSNHAGTLQIKVTDAAGRLLFTKSASVIVGNNSILMDLTKLYSGIYYLQSLGGKEEQTVKFIIDKSAGK